MRKRTIIILTIIFIVLVGACGYIYWATCTSNPWNADCLGDVPVPIGYERVEAEKGSYAEFLRSLPLKGRGSRVTLYTGGEARLQVLSAAVVDLPVLSNFEQCADMTMRLRAEYLYSRGRYAEISFRDVNGKRLQYRGGASRKAFEQYLRTVYGVCSTFSVYHETHPVELRDVRPGDVLVYPSRAKGVYGHAVLVADVARRGDRVAIMCVEGNTPAREAHIIRNLNPLHNPWHYFDGDEQQIFVSAFRFNRDELRRYQ